MYGPWFEHFLNLKPWDLERMSTEGVVARLIWVKNQLKATEPED